MSGVGADPLRDLNLGLWGGAIEAGLQREGDDPYRGSSAYEYAPYFTTYMEMNV